MRSRLNQILTCFFAFVASFVVLTPTAFAANNPNTGDNNMVPVVIGALVVSAILIVVLLLLSSKKKKR